MSGRVWGLVTAAIGAVMIGLMVAYGTEYGTWLDEVGPFIDDRGGRAPVAPTVILPAVVGLLAVALVVGGLVAGLTGRRAGTSGSSGP